MKTKILIPIDDPESLLSELNEIIDDEDYQFEDNGFIDIFKFRDNLKRIVEK